jgi:hypothetical protein
MIILLPANNDHERGINMLMKHTSFLRGGYISRKAKKIPAVRKQDTPVWRMMVLTS